MTYLESDALTYNLSGGALSASMTQSLVSDAVDLRESTGFSVQLVYTGSPVGTFTLEASNDKLNATPTTWVTVDNSSTAIAASGNFMINMEKSYFGWVRVKYTFTSGTGTIAVKIIAKG
jgi:hypothetical protein